MIESHLPLLAYAQRSQQMEYAANSSESMVIESLVNSVERLERLLDEENAALQAHRLAALEEFNYKKSQALLEWHRMIGTGDRPRFDDLGNLKPRLARLRQKLKDNLAMLQTHLNAGEAVAAIIARTIEEHESDGTYTPAIRYKDARL